MVFVVPKTDLPVMNYTPAKMKDELVMFGVTQNGPVIMYIDRDETVFVPWDEVIAFAATAPRQKPAEKPEPTPEEKKSPLREVRPEKK